MVSFTNDVIEEEEAAACLVQMHRQQLNRGECDSASEALFHIISGIHREKSYQKAVNSNVIKLFKTASANLAIPLAAPDDADYLSPLQCYIRQHSVEYFEATGDDAFSSKNQQQRGRRTPIVIGRVGIRCVYCKNIPFNERASQSTAFPSNLDKIYSSVVMWQCRHSPACREMPVKVRKHLAELKRGYGGVSSNGAARNKVWARTAKEKGFIDTKEGIKFLRPSADKDEEELARINNNPSTKDKARALAMVVTPKPIRPWVITPDDFIQVTSNNGILRDSDTNLFRPVKEYETLKVTPLIDNKGRRVSVYGGGLYCCPGFTMPGGGKEQDEDGKVKVA